MSARCTLTVHEEHGARPGLVNHVENVYAAVSGIPDELRLPVLDLSVVLTGDVTASIRQRGQRNFRPERVGGIAAGKTLALPRDSVLNWAPDLLVARKENRYRLSLGQATVPESRACQFDTRAPCAPVTVSV